MTTFHQTHEAPETSVISGACEWLRGLDLNQRPLGYEPNELPDCSTPHNDYIAVGEDQSSFFWIRATLRPSIATP